MTAVADGLDSEAFRLESNRFASRPDTAGGRDRNRLTAVRTEKSELPAFALSESPGTEGSPGIAGHARACQSDRHRTPGLTHGVTGTEYSSFFCRGRSGQVETLPNPAGATILRMPPCGSASPISDRNNCADFLRCPKRRSSQGGVPMSGRIPMNRCLTPLGPRWVVWLSLGSRSQPRCSPRRSRPR